MRNSPSIIESQNSDPQNPNTISDSENPFHNPVDSQHPLQNPSPEFPQEEKPQLSVEDQQEEEPQLTTEDQEQEDLEQEGTSVSLSPVQNPSMSNPAVSSVKRANKRRKGFAKNYKSQLAIEKKLQTLFENFNVIPFVPAKALDFSKHEELLRKLGLWDFAHIDFDKNLRADLIGQLVVNYAHNPKLRSFYVNDCRIGVNRADLGRALMLPGKKTAGDCEGEVYPAEFLSFLEEFVSNWMLLHGEDLWCTPTEIVNWMNLIRGGHPEKVDWAGLVWYMVEKELAQGQKLKNCYYASHLQQLIKSQKDDLLMEDSRVEVSVDDDDDCSEVKRLDYESFLGAQKSEGQNVELRSEQVENVDDDADKAEKVGDCGEMEKVGDCGEMEKVGDGGKAEKAGDEVEKDGDVDMVDNVDNKMEVSDDDVRNADNVDENNKLEDVERAEHGGSVEIADEHVEDADNTEEHVENVDTAEEHVDNFNDSANAKDTSKDVDMLDFGYQGQWLLDGRNDGGEHFMQRCSMGGVKVSVEHDKGHDGGGEDIENEDVEEVGDVEGFKIMPKNPLDGMSSANLMQAFGTGQMPFGPSELGGQSSLELVSSRPENNVMMGGPSMFNHAGKREMVHDHDISHNGLNDNHKKMRIDGSWDPKSHGLHMIFEQMHQLTEKAKIYHETVKEEVYKEASMTQQILNHQILEKENEIMQLRCKFDDQQRRMHMEIQRRDRELYLMNSVIDGYRRALKETQRAFAEYRKRCALVDEPIYKDAGDGGVVKSIMELEKEQIKQEEEKNMCILLEETYRKHLHDYELKWEELLDNVQSLDSRLVNAGKEVEILKEKLVKPKTEDSAHKADSARIADSDQNEDSALNTDSAQIPDSAQNEDCAQSADSAHSADSDQNQNES